MDLVRRLPGSESGSSAISVLDPTAESTILAGRSMRVWSTIGDGENSQFRYSSCTVRTIEASQLPTLPLLSAKLTNNRALKIAKWYPHGMRTVYASVVNPDLFPVFKVQLDSPPSRSAHRRADLTEGRTVNLLVDARIPYRR
jgi:hypothetical protein